MHALHSHQLKCEHERGVLSRVVALQVLHEHLQRAAVWNTKLTPTWCAKSHHVCLAAVERPTTDSLKELEDSSVLPLTLGFHLSFLCQAACFTNLEQSLLRKLLLELTAGLSQPAGGPLVGHESSRKSACSSAGSESMGRTMEQQHEVRRRETKVYQLCLRCHFRRLDNA